MWSKSDGDDGYESTKTGSSSSGSSGWILGHEPGWHRDPQAPGNIILGGRRHSTVSDSGDTGIGTYCSDSMEDDSSSSTTPLSFQPLSHTPLGPDDDGVPSVRVLPSPSSVSPCSSGRWSRSNQVLTPATSPLSTPSYLDMKEQRPIRKWSSLTKLSSSTDKSSARPSADSHKPDPRGSLDRGVLSGYRKEPRGSTVDLYLPLSSSSLSRTLLLRSPGAAPGYRYLHGSRSTGLETERSISSTLTSPAKHSSLDMSYSALAETKLSRGGGGAYALSLPMQGDSLLGHQADRSSPIQPAVRTQMWLTEQMEYRPKEGGAGAGDCLSPWQQEAGLNQTLMQSSLPVNTLVKLKEGLLRQRELEIDRQKQQILQLHARIRENELRAQQVLHSQRSWLEHAHILSIKEPSLRPTCQQPSDRLCCDEELGRKLAVAELEVLHLNEFFKQITQKYTEDIRKLEEKVKTRDRYISSLKKKCQRESEQNQEKQQRIETLEKYLSDLPTLDEVTQQAKQEQVQQKAKHLERTMSRLESSLQESCALLEEKNMKIELQARRETELIASVHGLQQKVQQCLDDGVRLPVHDLRWLEVENCELLQQQDHSSRLIKHQKEQIEKLTSKLTATSSRLQNKRGVPLLQQTPPPDQDGGMEPPNRAPPQQVELEEEACPSERPVACMEAPEVGRLLKEMSLCLLDLQTLCSILSQRAQGKEPNLSLLLGMKSLSVSAEESDSRRAEEEELRFKLLEVSQLRRDIDELRRSISDRYTQSVGTAGALSEAK
ncbi:centrosomal protein of 85 kDa-like isoform X2 [Cheilinus undulatus]|uniref:centrosomal protein of 85 kDa-like isoform X2 n=1 Tax=Cheilinus undulatus TaxID=241271 RepID=UPI001BD5277D|nr:centrosomal protein of 85 kDa-like isoform X2 [Cheilinus undulatus]